MQVRSNTAILLVAAMLALSGCYESRVPLAPREQATVDTTLFGIWLLAEQEDDRTPTRMHVRPYDAHSYAVEFCCADLLADHSETNLLRAHIVSVDGVAFANVQGFDEDDSVYLLFRYARSDNILTLRPVADDLFAAAAQTDLSTPEGLFTFVRTHLEDPQLYLDDVLDFKKADE